MRPALRALPPGPSALVCIAVVIVLARDALAREILAVRAAADSGGTRLAPSGAGPWTARLSSRWRSAGAQLRDAEAAGAAAPAAAAATWIDVPCDVFPPGSVGARQARMPTATLVRALPDAPTRAGGYDPLGNSYDVVVSGFASAGGVLAQESVGIIAARIPPPITAQNIRRVELRFVVTSTNLFPYERVGFTELSTPTAPSCDLGPAALRRLHEDARRSDGTLYYVGAIPTGAYALDLGQAAVTDLAARAGGPGWFGVGLAADGWDFSGSLGRSVRWRAAGAGSPDTAQRPCFRLYYNAPPDAFALLDPPDSVDVAASVPRLSWAAASDPNGDHPLLYTVHLTSVVDGGPAFTLEAGTATTLTPSGPMAPGTYVWEVSARDPGGAHRSSARWSFRLVQSTAAAAPQPDRCPLLAPVSDPFNRGAELRFHLPRSGAVLVRVEDAHGRHAAQLLDGELAAGDHALRWDGADASGVPCASGVYFAVLETALGAARARLALVR